MAREIGGVFRVSYFLKTISAAETSGMVIRSRQRDRDVFAQFDGENWVFQGCQLAFDDRESCEDYIEEKLELLISKLSHLSENE